MRSLEEGLRYPSDDVLVGIANRLDLDPKELILEAYCDRSPILREAITSLMADVDGTGAAAPDLQDGVSRDTRDNGESAAGAE